LITFEKLIYSIQLNNNNYKLKNSLFKIEFYNRLNKILGIISDNNYFKLKCDLSEIISENNNLYKFINILMENNIIQRAIVSDKNLEDQIVKLLSVKLDKFFMIYKSSK